MSARQGAVRLDRSVLCKAFGITFQQYLAHKAEYDELEAEVDAVLTSDLPRNEQIRRYVPIHARMTRIVTNDESWLLLGDGCWARFGSASTELLTTALGHLDDGPLKDAVRAKLLAKCGRRQ